MRFKNDGPVTLYVVMDVELGSVIHAVTNKKAARDFAERNTQTSGRVHKVLTYDQRGL